MLYRGYSMIGFVYVWTNLINGKRYVGSHEGTESDGYVGSGKYFNNAVNKYGIENFQREIIESSDYSTRKELFGREQYWLDKFNAAKDLMWYNIAEFAGGGGNTRLCWTEQQQEEFKKKIASIWEGRSDDEIHKIAQKRLLTISKDPTWASRMGSNIKKAYAKKDKEFYQQRAVKINAKYGTEKRSEVSKKSKELMGEERRKAAAQKAADNTTVAVRAAAVEKASNTKRNKSLEEKLATAALKREAMIGKCAGVKNGRARSVCAAGIVYNTLKDAMRGLGISEPTLYKRIKSDQYIDYYYIDRK